MSDRTGIVIPPPILVATPFIAGWLLHRRWEWRILEAGSVAVALGLGIAAVGSSVAIAGVREFRRARTTVLPFGGTMRIVSSGVYRWTRNPMYLGMSLVYVGTSLVFNSSWCLAFLPAVVLLLWVMAIRPEERYLSDKFGEGYDRYSAATPRWL